MARCIIVGGLINHHGSSVLHKNENMVMVAFITQLSIRTVIFVKHGAT